MDIPILKVALPSLAELTPYLQRIDQSRIYSNFGPLLLEFEARLAGRLGLEPAGLVGVANATLGLTAALQAQQPEPGSLCLIPAWTFIASPLAALGAGLRPCFLDVDPEDWALRPAAVLAALPDLPGRAGAVMPVAPFGQRLDGAAWEDFRDRTGLAVAIDAAAAFDTMQPVRVPSVVSLHATKSLGVGEGGFVACTDTALIKRVRSLTSFGFSGQREAILPGTNAKLSEYQAALGLAGLDGWAGRRAAIAGRIAAYRAAFGDSNRIGLQSGFGTDWIANTLVVRLPDGTAPLVLEHLQKVGIQARYWWGAGAHAHPATRDMPHLPLPATELLARSTIGLPFHAELQDAEILRVAAEVKQALDRADGHGCASRANPGNNRFRADLSRRGEIGAAALDPLLHRLSEILSVPPASLTDDLAMQEVPSWNSLTHIDLVVGLEEAFAIELTQDEIVEMQSIGAIRRILVARGVVAG